jgi:hypothetical protein
MALVRTGRDRLQTRAGGDSFQPPPWPPGGQQSGPALNNPGRCRLPASAAPAMPPVMTAAVARSWPAAAHRGDQVGPAGSPCPGDPGPVPEPEPGQRPARATPAASRTAWACTAVT